MLAASMPEKTVLPAYAGMIPLVLSLAMDNLPCSPRMRG